MALNKIDVPDGREIGEMVTDELRERGLRVFPVSAASSEGLRELTFAMAEIVDRARREKPVAETTRIVIRPASADGSDEFTVKETGEGWRVRGVKPERWVRQTDFGNDEAVGFLADRLNRLGVEARLLQLGAQEGDAVLIGHPDDAVVFDFKPGIDAGAEVLSRRGEDQRFDETRPAARRRREIDAAMGERGETETRADVARRLDKPETYGPSSYEIGSEGRPRLGRAGPRGMSTPGRRADVVSAKRIVVKVGSSSLTTAAGGIDPDRVRQLVDVLAAARDRRLRGGAGLVGCDRRRAGPARAGPPAARPRPPSRRRRRSGRGCWCTATPRSSPGTASSPGRCCSPTTT